jgi:hypothetical protein
MVNYRGMGLREAVWVAAALLALPAGAYGQSPPGNDNYLQSFGLNTPGSRLERTDTLRATADTTNATVQSDVFSPPQSGGPAEPTACQGGVYGKTVWYDFYPDVNGAVQLRASGYDTVINVVPFDRATGRPDFGRAQCVNQSASTTEVFIVEVRGRDAYTVQLGGVNNAGGPLEFLFDFLADTDGDGVLDDVDRCDRLDGARSNNGCPRRPRVNTTLRALPTPNGIELVGLSVRAPRGSRVEVRCRGCGRQVKRARSTVGFPALRGRALRAGTNLDIRVTRRGSFGAFVRYRVLAGNFKRTERCMNPGSRVPRRRCG